MARRTHPVLAALAAGALLAGLSATGAQAAGSHPAAAKDPYYTTKTPTSKGFGGAVSSVDPEASKIGLDVLKQGGNAVDAAVATAAALGVTEPYSSGLGGGGFFVYYEHKTGQVHTIDGRETAPAGMQHNAFIDPHTGQPYPFTPERVTSGVSVGVPGSPATWQAALDQWGSFGLARTLAPAEQLARRGFVVDDTFHKQTEENKQRFEAYTTTPQLYLPNGDAPPVGSVLKNPDLADTYQQLGSHGMSWFYHGPIADEIANAVQHPPKSSTTTLPVMPGSMDTADLASYRTVDRAPTHTTYRGHDVYGMPPASSGGTTVGEALNIMKHYDLPSMSTAQQLHHYLWSTALAFGDRNKYIGDPSYVKVPEGDLLSDKYAVERACSLDEKNAPSGPVAAGDVSSYDGSCHGKAAQPGKQVKDTENVETTNMTVTDKWGNVVEYTLTIEQTGGSGQLLAHRGFILNNELTDFSAVYDQNDPNRIDPGKRPRSSISPTIILDNGKPFLALGSPGGATIITTVTQLIFDRIDRGMPIEDAIADPRGSDMNSFPAVAEQSFIDKYGAMLSPYGWKFNTPGPPGSSASEIGAATAIEFGKAGLLTAVSEPSRRGGGSALVVSPTPAPSG